MKYFFGIHICVQAMLLFIPSPVFAYNLAHDFDPCAISWIEERSSGPGDVIIDDTDIVRFDWDKQIFEITPQAAMEFIRLENRLEYPFKLIYQNETIYRGFFVNPISSKAYNGPVIILDIPVSTRLKIQNGYGKPSEQDQRFDSRLKAALLAKDLLADIDLNSPPDVIEVNASGWVVDTNAVKVRLVAFPQSFVINGSPKIYLKFAAKPEFDMKTVFEYVYTIKTIDSNCKLTKKEQFKVDDILRGTFCVTTSLVPDDNQNILPGPAMMSSELIIHSQTPRKIAFPPSYINILPLDCSLQARLVPQSDFFTIGSAMLLKLVVENSGRFPLKIDKQIFFPRISVIDPCGINLKIVSGGVQTCYHPVIVRPGKTWLAFENYNLAEDYVITQPGLYTFQMNKLVKPVQVNIKPGRLTPEDEIYIRLRKIIPKEMYVEKFRNKFSGNNFIFLISKHTDKGSSGPWYRIRLALIREPAEKPISGFDFFGHSQWGAIYFKNENVQAIWPDYKKEIAGVLEIAL